jgi:hypothetical protein
MTPPIDCNVLRYIPENAGGKPRAASNHES